jgi:putative phosphoesterase
MRIAIFSDIHGNLPALTAALADIEAEQPDRLYCLGDLVGYASSPNEVIDLIRERHVPTIMGNYDDGVGFERAECGCAYRDPIDQELGQQSLEWTKAQTTDANKAFLRGLVRQIRFEADGRRILLVHGSPRKMNEYLFEDRPLSSFQRLAHGSGADVIAFGHTHMPYVKSVDGVLFVNVGSVGKPKDRDIRGCYAVLETSQLSVTLRRVPYDVAAAADAIRQTTLPAKFARDLELAGASEPAAMASSQPENGFDLAAVRSDHG